MRRTILCVDDNTAFTDNMRDIFEDAGYQVRLAASCREAREQARGCDVALVDLRLPDGDGTVLAGELHELVPDLRIILLTGFATLESAIAAVRAGASAYLMKPCATPEVLLAVEQAVHQHEVDEEKRALERRARVAEKLAAVGTLTAGLSHEIKNPLNAASLQLMVLERRIGRLPAAQQEDLRGPLGLVQHEITRLNGLLEEFLQFASARELELVPTDAGALLERLVALMTAQAEKASVRIEPQLAARPQVMAHPARLEQALMNLMLNAIQATPAGGKVIVGLERGGRITIDDTGPGVPEELASRIFEPFFTTKSAGSGLGLPLVHRIVQEHGGSISVERAPSGGARFAITLTLAKEGA